MQSMNATTNPAGQTYQETMRLDPGPRAPRDFYESHPYVSPRQNFDRARYVEQSFHDLEIARLWPNVWQFACRAEEIPEPGDVHVYEIGSKSFLLIRQEDGSVGGFYNSCRHRGTKLCATHTSVVRLRCPFHGFTWEIDGRFSRLPAAWDFPHVAKSDFGLLKVRTEVWQGFVFLNENPNAPDLLSYLEVLPEHFSGFSDHSSKYVKQHYTKVLECNWKVAQEAFLESFHSEETHPQVTAFTPSESVQYDVFPGCRHTSRFLEAMAKPGQDFANSSEQRIMDAMFAEMAVPAPVVASGQTARDCLASVSRGALNVESDIDYSPCSIAETIDVAQYFLFPNMTLFRGSAFPMVYRFRPWRDDPNQCLFDFLVMADFSGVRPDYPETIDLTDLRFADAPEMPNVTRRVFDQDTINLPLQQAGLRADPRGEVVFSRYQESRILHMHDTLDLYLGNPTADLRPDTARASCASPSGQGI